MPGRRLMLAYYAVSVVIGLLTLAVDPGAAFGGRGLMLWVYGLGYALAGAYGVLTRSLGRASSERVAVATLAALSWVHGVAPSQGAWVAGMRLVNAILFTAVWLVMFSQLTTTTIPRGDTRGLVRPRRHRGDDHDRDMGRSLGVAEGSPRGPHLSGGPDGASSGDAHSGDGSRRG